MPKLWTLVAMNLVASLQGTVDHHKARNNKLGVEILRWISLPTFFGLSSYTIYKFLILRYNDEGRKNTSDEFLCIIELWKSESLARGIKCWQIQLPVHFYSGFPPPPHLKLVSDSSENSASLENYWQFWMLEKTLQPTPGFSVPT